MSEVKELAIIGGGPGGLTAGLYAMRSGISAELFEKGVCGGQMMGTLRVDNYPGFPEGVTGPELSDSMLRQAEGFGLPIRYDEISKIELEDGIFWLSTEGGRQAFKRVIISTGASARKLDVSGEEELAGMGVSYCATCDGAFFKEKDIVVVGGGDSAVEEGVFLTNFARKVTIIHRRNQLRAEKYIQEQAFENPKVDFIWDSVVSSINGKNKVDSVTVKNVKNGEERELKTDGVFIYVGLFPNVDLLGDMAEKDHQGFIITDSSMQTSQPGLFAIGDVRSKLLRQIVTATSDGATAVMKIASLIQFGEHT